MKFDNLNFESFQWDTGNDRKSLDKHGITCQEAEEALLNQPLMIVFDEKHSQREKRYRALGRTNKNKYLQIVFTMRGKQIRIISVRPMHRKERKIYEKN